MGIKKSSRREISIENFRGRIRLRWRHSGERYALNLPFAYQPENMHHATVKATEIKLDIMKGCFDPTLAKYKPQPIRPTVQSSITPVAKVEQVLILGQLVEKFNDWGKNIRNVDVDNSIDYLYVRRLLEKWATIPLSQLAAMLNNKKWAVTTYNRRLTCLNTFLSWLMETGTIQLNPLKGVSRKRGKGKKKNPKRKPLEVHEIVTFLQAIKDDVYTPPSSSIKHSFYYPFLFFIFSTGVRNAEAIGLRIRHVDIANRQVEISEAFARTVKGTNHSARVQKGTKMGNVRRLPLNEELMSLLDRQIAGKQPDSFVFPSPRGLSIDDRMLQKRIIKPVLKKLGFEERDLYAARHSFGTRAVQQGMALTDLAYLMGHSTIETAVRNYVSVSRPAVALPSIKESSSQVQDDSTVNPC